MVGFLKEFADFITKNTGLPVEIEPSPASPPEAHVRIIPKGLSYQSYGNTPNDLAKQGLVQLFVELHLVAQGTGEVFLKMIYEASLKLNRLFESYHAITLGTENSIGFSACIDKFSDGEFFVNQEEGKFPYTFVEKWKGTLTWRMSSVLE